MTEYTVSSQALREYMTSRERTAYWVKSHEPETAFYSPSAPPTVIDDYLPPSSPPSEVESLRSVPPKMFLRYNDGRPDQAIPYSSKISGGMTSFSGSGHRRSQPPHSQRTRSGSHGTSLLGRSQPRRPDDRPRPPPLKPEEIRILPSQGEVSSPPTSSSRHTRSKSLPRTTAELRPLADAPDVPQVPFFPPPSHRSPTPYQTPPHSAGTVPGQQISFAPPRHQQPGRHSNSRQPPAIIYAPSHHANRSHYAPPAILHHPPQMGPNGMIYSHSAPVGSSQYPPAVATPYPSVGGSAHHHSSSLHDVRRGREFYRERGRAAFKGTATRIISPSASSTSLTNTHDSGSTYYVLPTHGQKVHVIAPSREQSVGTATSTTKSATSPYAQSFGKRPFFQRLFSFAGKFSSGGSSKGAPTGGRKLHRRHSIGASARPRVAA